jgi:hydrogenase maturation protein HypF
MDKGLNSPPASSAGRLFDAVAASLMLVTGEQAYESEAAMRLEALACQLDGDVGGYPFDIIEAGDLMRLSPAPLWPALLDDLGAGVAAPVIARRFHLGLAAGLADLTRQAEQRAGIRSDRVVLSGGSMQNPVLVEALMRCLNAAGFETLSHGRVPANDGGLALGQAAIAAARLIP